MRIARPSAFVTYGSLVSLILLTLGVLVFAQQPGTSPATSNGTAGAVARGKYLVEQVAVCGNCHTPRDEKGELDRSRALAGTSLFFRPAQPMPDWPIVAPRIGGTPPGTDEEMITLLTTGIWKTGKHLQQPMPQFRFTREDAQAVVAFLRSMNNQP
jgi:Cytochrome c